MAANLSSNGRLPSSEGVPLAVEWRRAAAREQKLLPCTFVGTWFKHIGARFAQGMRGHKACSAGVRLSSHI
eukprot:12924461-Prorocentrum_lima.AAC.1